MYAGKYLELISYMRHDFLNHLQVISGYLQLGKSDKAGEYIQNVTGNLQKLRKVVHLEVPEIAAALLLGEEMAAGVQAETVYNVDPGLSGCSVPGEVAGNAVLGCLQRVVDLMPFDAANGAPPRLLVDIKQAGDYYCCTLNFDSTPAFEAEAENIIAENGGALSLYGGRLEWSIAGGGKGQLEIYLPRG